VGLLFTFNFPAVFHFVVFLLLIKLSVKTAIARTEGQIDNVTSLHVAIQPNSPLFCYTPLSISVHISCR